MTPIPPPPSSGKKDFKISEKEEFIKNKKLEYIKIIIDLINDYFSVKEEGLGFFKTKLNFSNYRLIMKEKFGDYSNYSKIKIYHNKKIILKFESKYYNYSVRMSNKEIYNYKLDIEDFFYITQFIDQLQSYVYILEDEKNKKLEQQLELIQAYEEIQ